ncbi:MAG: YhbY family RNA-binding protein [Candidatus Woesearchaeota archaeon]
MKDSEDSRAESSKEESKKLLQEASALPVTMQIGKMGITPGVVSELEKQLEKRGIVKVRILKNYMHELDRFQVAEALATKSGARLLQIKGFVAVYYKKRIEKKM